MTATRHALAPDDADTLGRDTTSPSAPITLSPGAAAWGPRHGGFLGYSKSGFHRIAYTEWGDSASRRVVVCVHGLTRQGRDFDPVALSLARLGYRVVCPDLVGRGRSDWLGDPDEYALPQYCADMAGLLARLDVDTIDWIGTSLGGLIGIVLAARDKTPIRRLVINDVGPYLSFAALLRIGGYIQTMPHDFANYAAAEAYMRTVLAPFGRLSNADWLHLTQHSVAREADGRYRMLCDPRIARGFSLGSIWNLSLWNYWDVIACPTLVLRGATSDLLLAETAADMTRRGPRTDLVEIPGCGHAPALLDPDQIALITSWLGPIA